MQEERSKGTGGKGSPELGEACPPWFCPEACQTSYNCVTCIFPSGWGKTCLGKFPQELCVCFRDRKVRGNGGRGLSCGSLRGRLGSETTGQCGCKMLD